MMDIQNFIAEFKKTFVYDILSQTLSDEQLFEHVVDGDAVLWFKEQTRQMWLMWEKAQAVPDLGELQERIAGHQYYHDEHGHMIVDMDDVVKEISGFDSWKAQAVPEGYVLIPKKMPDEVNDHLWDFMTDNFVCTNDYGDSFMACDDFDLEKFYAE
ncbi:hypothetical protein WCD96_18675, partial [Proteus mirabilis]|uniref:hypothetical protein n=1 Tax=Proteus mirabilis TaxID=584 RepID=UPI0034D762D7